MGQPRGTPLVFDQQVFVEAMGALAAAIAQASAVGGQVTSNCLLHIILRHSPGEGI